MGQKHPLKHKMYKVQNKSLMMKMAYKVTKVP